MAHRENTSVRPFPVKVFTAALVLTIAVFAGIGWHVWNSYKNFKTIQIRDFRLQELSGIITHFDEVLTMSARMAASTGDLWWEERYKVFEPQLDAAIKEAMKLEPKTFMSEAAAQTNTANLKLVAIEKRAFDLVRQGRREKAAFLLFGEEYENQKLIYSEGMKKITVALQENVRSDIHRQRRQAFLAVASILFTIPILLFVWFVALQSMRKHITDRKRAEEALKKSEEEYRKLVETMNEGLGVTDENYIFTYVNSKFCNMLGYSKNEMLGQHLTKFVAEDYQAVMREQIAKRKRGEAAPFELVWRSKYDRRVYTLASPKGIFDSDGRFKGSLGVLTDITEFKKAEEEIKRKAEQLKGLYELGKKVTSITSKEKLLPWIAEQAAKLLDADECLYRIREGDYLIRGGGTKKGMELMETKRLKIGQSLSGIIVKEKRPLISKDIREDERYKKEHREVAKRLGLVSFLGVPMCIERRVVGVLNIMSKKTRKFTEEDTELLSAFADIAAIALEKARLYGEAIKKVTQLNSLYEVNKMITSEIKRDKLFPLIAEQANKLLGADGCNFRLREGDDLVRSYGTRESIDLMAKERIAVGESLGGIIAKEKKPVTVEDVREDKRYIKEHREVARRLGFISFLGVPMMIRDEVVGVINIHSKRPRKFTEEDTGLLSALADQAAIAIEKLRLFESLEGAKEELEKWGKDLEEKVEKRTRELKDVQVQLIHSERLAATGRLAASIAHEINNPLQAIDSFVSTVMKNIDQKSQDREYLKFAQEGINRIARIVKQLLAFHRPEADEKSLEDINAIVKKTLSLTKNQLSLTNIKVREEFSSNLPKVRVSSQQIHQVLLNLILNAQDAMPEGGEIRIKTEKSDGAVHIEVSDTGLGIPKEIRDRMFEPFFSTKKGEKGTGLGLSISYGIIKAHNGDIQVKSKEKEGTTFTITLPVDSD